MASLITSAYDYYLTTYSIRHDMIPIDEKICATLSTRLRN